MRSYRSLALTAGSRAVSEYVVGEAGDFRSIWYLLRDQRVRSAASMRQLEHHFNDLYHLFLAKLVKITSESALSRQEKADLRGLMDELLEVKTMLEGSE